MKDFPQPAQNPAQPYLLIGLSGAPGAGKDFCADLLKGLLFAEDSASGSRIVEVETFAFAGALYALAAQLLSFNPSGRHDTEPISEAKIRTYKAVYRPFLKKLFGLMKEYSPYTEFVLARQSEAVLRKFLQVRQHLHERNSRIAIAGIFTDLRLQNEVELLGHYGGIEILIRRPEAEAHATAQAAITANDVYETRWWMMKDLPENLDPRVGPLVVFNDGPYIQRKLETIVTNLLQQSKTLNSPEQRWELPRPWHK